MIAGDDRQPTPEALQHDHLHQPWPTVMGEVGKRSSLLFTCLLPLPPAGTYGRARWYAAVSSRGVHGLDALIDLQVIRRVLPRRHPEGR